MGDYRKLFSKDYIKAFDLEGYPEGITVTIASIQVEPVRKPPKSGKQGEEGETEDEPVLFFKGAAKRLILNRTNADAVASLYGNDTDGWIGKRITLFVQPGIKAFGKTWEAVRVKPMVPPDRNGTKHDNVAPLQHQDVTPGMDREIEPPPLEREHLDRDIAALYGEESASAAQAPPADPAPITEAEFLLIQCRELIEALPDEERVSLGKTLESIQEGELKGFREYLAGKLQKVTTVAR